MNCSLFCAMVCQSATSGTLRNMSLEKAKAPGVLPKVVATVVLIACAKAEAAGLTGNELALASGQAAISNLMLFPAVLIVAFGGFYFIMRKKHSESSGD